MIIFCQKETLRDDTLTNSKSWPLPPSSSCAETDVGTALYRCGEVRLRKGFISMRWQKALEGGARKAIFLCQNVFAFVPACEPLSMTAYFGEMTMM